MIGESDIRGQTKIILDAYADLTGETGSLSVSDFLLIRRSAEDELKSNSAHMGRISSGSRQEKSEVPAQEQHKPSPKEEKKRDVKYGNMPFSVVRDNSQAQRRKPESAPVEDEGEDAENAVPESPFSILKNIEDVWN